MDGRWLAFAAVGVLGSLRAARRGSRAPGAALRLLRLPLTYYEPVSTAGELARWLEQSPASTPWLGELYLRDRTQQQILASAVRAAGGSVDYPSPGPRTSPSWPTLTLPDGRQLEGDVQVEINRVVLEPRGLMGTDYTYELTLIVPEQSLR